MKDVFIYVVKCHDIKLLKVGISKAPLKRVKSYTKDFTLWVYDEVFERQKAARLESLICQNNRQTLVKGLEWFHYDNGISLDPLDRERFIYFENMNGVKTRELYRSIRNGNRGKNRKQRRPRIIGVKFTEEEYNYFKQISLKEGLTLSNSVRKFLGKEKM